MPKPKRKQINVPGYKGPDRRSGKDRRQVRGHGPSTSRVAQDNTPFFNPISRKVEYGPTFGVEHYSNERRSGKDRRKKP